MTHVTLPEVQQWLEPTKLTLTDVDTELDATWYAKVASTLSGRYDTSSWLNDTNTPAMIKVIISMYIAGTLYNRAYSEEGDVASYGTWLIRYADNLLSAVDSGQAVLVGLDSTRE